MRFYLQKPYSKKYHIPRFWVLSKIKPDTGKVGKMNWLTNNHCNEEEGPEWKELNLNLCRANCVFQRVDLLTSCLTGESNFCTFVNACTHAYTCLWCWDWTQGILHAGQVLYHGATISSNLEHCNQCWGGWGRRIWPWGQPQIHSKTLFQKNQRGGEGHWGLRDAEKQRQRGGETEMVM